MCFTSVLQGVFVSLSLHYKGNNIILLCKHFGEFSCKKNPHPNHHGGRGNTKEKV